MSRRSFIESQGATCRNWTWSWAFINERERVVIFGAWDKNTDGNTSLILDERWERNYKGRKNPAYAEALDYVRLVESGGYTLKTFPIIYSDALKDEEGHGPAKIKGFVPTLTTKSLKKVEGQWYASDDLLSARLPEEVAEPEKYTEGASRTVSVNSYERNPQARTACIRHYGTTCAVCGFDFKAAYGEIGAGFIHVHHLVPLSEIGKEYELDPIKDLRPVCPNCHAIIHRTQPALAIEQLKAHLRAIRDA